VGDFTDLRYRLDCDLFSHGTHGATTSVDDDANYMLVLTINAVGPYRNSAHQNGSLRAAARRRRERRRAPMLRRLLVGVSHGDQLRVRARTADERDADRQPERVPRG